MVTVKKFEDLQAWQEARKLVNDVYSLIRKPAFSKDYALRDQIVRAAISTMSNIAEGFEGATDQQFIQFLIYSRRSCSEVQSHLYVALDNEYISQNEFKKAYVQAETARKISAGFITYLRKTAKNFAVIRQSDRKTGGQDDRRTNNGTS